MGVAGAESGILGWKCPSRPSWSVCEITWFRKSSSSLASCTVGCGSCPVRALSLALRPLMRCSSWYCSVRCEIWLLFQGSPISCSCGAETILFALLSPSGIRESFLFGALAFFDCGTPGVLPPLSCPLVARFVLPA